ncbi:MAG: signal peptidase II [Acidobacteria bacterium]|nr:signal peptidase II [Acidobacteriota bacterium]
MTSQSPDTPLPDAMDAGNSVAPTLLTPGRPFARPFELGAMALVVLLDQVTKALVRANVPLGDSRTIVSGFLDIAHVQNTGAAFGMLNGVDFPYKSFVMVAIAGIALLAIAAYGTQLGFHDRLARFGLALILGGAFGNLLDRAIVGHVVDFVDVYWGDLHFWAFNVADAAISVGAVLVILDTLGLGRRHASHPV